MKSNNHQMTVKQIITKYLTDNGYDGLTNGGTCFCVGELPCIEFAECTPTKQPTKKGESDENN